MGHVMGCPKKLLSSFCLLFLASSKDTGTSPKPS